MYKSGNTSFLTFHDHSAESEVDSDSGAVFALGQSVVPEPVGRWVHHEEATVGQGQFDRRDDTFRRAGAARVCVLEHEVASLAERDGSNRRRRLQFSFVVFVVTHVVVAVLVSVKIIRFKIRINRLV